MSNKTQHTIQNLLRNWLSGNTSAEQEKTLRKKAQNDPFLKDAIDGFDQNKGNHNANLNKLKKDLRQKYQPQGKRLVLYLPRIAAAAAILLIGLVGIWYLNSSVGSADIAANTEALKKSDPTPTETIITKDANNDVESNDEEFEPIAQVQEEEKKQWQSKTESTKKVKPKAKTEVVQATPPKDKTTPNKKTPNKATEAVEIRSTQEQSTEYYVDGVSVESNTATVSGSSSTETYTTEVLDAEPIVMSEPPTSAAQPRPEPPTSADYSNYEDSDGIVYSDTPKDSKTTAEAMQVEDAAIMVIEDFSPIQGIILDENGEPLIGVNIVETNTNNGTVSDFDGKFEFKPVSLDNSMLISYIGYEDKIVNIEPEMDNYQISLENSNINLEEVVIAASAAKEDSNLPETKIKVFPSDGYKAYKKYIDESLLYPQTAVDNNIEGKVVLQFQVKDDGRPQNFQVLKSLGYGCDEEAIRLLQDGPDWQKNNTTSQEGMPTKYTVKFKLKKE